MKDTNQQYLNSLTAIQEIRTVNPSMSYPAIYKLLGIKSAALNYWTKRVFGLTIANLIRKRMLGEDVRTLKCFKVKHYVTMTAMGMEALMQMVNRHAHTRLVVGEHVEELAYGAIDENNMLCVQLAGNARNGVSGSRLAFTNYALTDESHYTITPYTIPEIVLGIQKRNKGQEIY